MVLNKWEYFCLSGSLWSESIGRNVTETLLRCIRSEKEFRKFSAKKHQVSFVVLCLLNVRTVFRGTGSHWPYICLNMEIKTDWNHKWFNIIKSNLSPQLKSFHSKLNSFCSSCCSFFSGAPQWQSSAATGLLVLNSHLPLIVTDFRSICGDGSLASVSDWEVVGKPRLLDRDWNNACTLTKEISCAVCGCEKKEGAHCFSRIKESGGITII